MDKDDLIFFMGASLGLLWVPLFFAAVAYQEKGMWLSEWTPLLLVSIAPGIVATLFMAGVVLTYWRRR